jgi:hypothetical protein
MGGIFMAVTGFEPAKNPSIVWANTWFDLGFAFVVLGALVVAAGVVMHFRRGSTAGQRAVCCQCSARAAPVQAAPLHARGILGRRMGDLALRRGHEPGRATRAPDAHVCGEHEPVPAQQVSIGDTMPLPFDWANDDSEGGL